MVTSAASNIPGLIDTETCDWLFVSIRAPLEPYSGSQGHACFRPLILMISNCAGTWVHTYATLVLLMVIIGPMERYKTHIAEVARRGLETQPRFGNL